ncbi:MAG: trehalose-6-phosphate synthase [Phycisphaerales bacterium JB040]
MEEKSQFVVMANRLPVRRVGSGDEARWEISPGGLVSALIPPMRAHAEVSGAASAWVGWSGYEDGETGVFEHEGILNVPVALSGEDLRGYYEGMSNSSLWPLYHDAIRPPQYHRKWYRQYEEVNERFAHAAAEVAGEGAIVWVHDYHLHLAPGMLRALRPDLKIGYFLHIPFPGRGLFAQLPWRSSLLEGTLGADVVGFQSEYAAQNFTDLAEMYAGAERIEGGVRFRGRGVTVGSFPISIDSKKLSSLAREPRVVQRAAEFRHRLGDRKILLGVDRMDYTKGIDIRLLALQDLLASGRLSIKDVVLIQSAVPTRDLVADYAELRSRIEELVGQINGEYGEVGLVGVQYLRQNVPLEELAAMYLAADVMVVTSYRDGMNLVAKEYIAARHDDTGVLVLSEFTGAAAELTDAVIVNPHDLDGLASALERAVHMPEAEMNQRMSRLRKHVAEHDVHRWALSFLERLGGGTPREAAGAASHAGGGS